MYNIDWTELDKKRYDDLQRELKSGTHDFVDDCIGEIRVGDCCFDVILCMDTEYDFYIIDCYVYGLDYCGYANASDGTPYEQFDGFCYKVNTNEDYDTFQKNINNEIVDFFNNTSFDEVREKATKETLFWY